MNTFNKLLQLIQLIESVEDRLGRDTAEVWISVVKDYMPVDSPDPIKKLTPDSIKMLNDINRTCRELLKNKNREDSYNNKRFYIKGNKDIVYVIYLNDKDKDNSYSVYKEDKDKSNFPAKYSVEELDRCFIIDKIWILIDEKIKYPYEGIRFRLKNKQYNSNIPTLDQAIYTSIYRIDMENDTYIVRYDDPENEGEAQAGAPYTERDIIEKFDTNEWEKV
jgi:hypothetical protein